MRCLSVCVCFSFRDKLSLCAFVIFILNHIQNLLCVCLFIWSLCGALLTSTFACSLTLYYDAVIAAIFHSVSYDRTRAISVTVCTLARVHHFVYFTLLSVLAGYLSTHSHLCRCAFMGFKMRYPRLILKCISGGLMHLTPSLNSVMLPSYGMCFQRLPACEKPGLIAPSLILWYKV